MTRSCDGRSERLAKGKSGTGYQNNLNFANNMLSITGQLSDTQSEGEKKVGICI